MKPGYLSPDKLLAKLEERCIILMNEREQLTNRIQEINDELIRYRQATLEPGPVEFVQQGTNRLDVLHSSPRQDRDNSDTLCPESVVLHSDEDDTWVGAVYAVDRDNI